MLDDAVDDVKEVEGELEEILGELELVDVGNVEVGELDFRC